VQVALVEKGGSRFGVRVTFSRGADKQHKYAGEPFMKTRSPDPAKKLEEFKRCIAQAAKEANRDMILRELHAKSDGKVTVSALRAHPEWSSSFPELADEVVRRLNG
jgi:hypothetical protein